MRSLRTLRLAPLALAFFVLAGCVTRAAAPPAVASPDLSGPWDFDMDVGAQTLTRGAFTLERRAEGYRGELTTNRGTNRLPVRSVTLVHDRVTLVVESPDGIVTSRGLLAGDARGMSGVVTYHDGRVFPMVVRRAGAGG